MIQSDEWKDKAACKGMPVNMFFDEYEHSVKVQLEVDKICGSCKVSEQCLQYAVENDLCGGVFKKYIAIKGRKR